MVEGEISHDKVTRFLSSEEFTSSTLWKLIKPKVREIESEEGVIIVDDTIEEKPSTDENEIVSWHYDHSKGKSVKGIQTQSNHIFASIYSFFKLEFISIRAKFNQTALRSKLYISANRTAFNELRNMKACFAMKF